MEGNRNICVYIYVCVSVLNQTIGVVSVLKWLTIVLQLAQLSPKCDESATI